MRENTIDLEDGELEPKRVEGGTLPATVHDLDSPLPQEGQPLVVPSGPHRKPSETNKGGSR